VCVCKYLKIRSSPYRSPHDASVEKTLGSRDLCRAHGYRPHRYVRVRLCVIIMLLTFFLFFFFDSDDDVDENSNAAFELV